MSPAYTIPPGFIGLAFAIAAIVVAYYYGFSSGTRQGETQGTAMVCVKEPVTQKTAGGNRMEATVTMRRVVAVWELQR